MKCGPIRSTGSEYALLVWGLSLLVGYHAAAAKSTTARATDTSDRAGISIFTLPKLPTPVEQTQCHMGECSWEQVTGIDEIKHLKSEVLREIHSRTTTTETPKGRDYPAVLDPHAHIIWKQSTSYVLCSLSRPALIWRDDDAGSYMEAPLHVVSPFGYEQSAVSEYLMACHGAFPDSKKARNPAHLGYLDRRGSTPETRIAEPERILDNKN